MDKKLENLINSIMKECENDGEPVSYEEAKEMAEMELKANKDCKRYEMEAPKKKVEKVRKVDTEKASILDSIKAVVESIGGSDTSLKTETELSFKLNDNSYTVKLIKHRPKK